MWIYVRMRFLKTLSTLLCCTLSSANSLDPGGKNVCKDVRNPSTLVCCPGWRQQENNCNIPICEGEHACLEKEECVLPGVCRCPPGYYGAQCKTRCPNEFWAPDCRRICRCHPNGRCDPFTGECVCNPNRWGPFCQNTCKCTRHGLCHPVYGNCTCDEGWWTPTCSKPCQCSVRALSIGCDQQTGVCECDAGHWGSKCSSNCNCNQSPCNQRTGACKCAESSWGPTCDRKCNCDLTHSRCDPDTGQCLCNPGYHGHSCNQPCKAGKYGSGCTVSCGYCRGRQPCSATDGTCASCEPGWNGTRCDRLCAFGFYGDDCKGRCPRCRDNEPCDPTTGKCWRCDPGWTGPRCEDACSDRMYGDACSFLCGACFHGNCHHVTGKCVCEPGFQGESCNSSCPAFLFGPNCSSTCDCGEGIACNSVTGACPSSYQGAVLAGVLVPLFLFLLAVLCCCLCCGGGPIDPKESATLADGNWSVRMKYHVYSVLANIGASLPCISNWSSGLPRVTVSHHDPELTFNHSFIEPPSSGWVTDEHSFDSDEEEEEEEALYCVPPREDIPAIAGGEFQEMSSKCNMFLDPSGFSSEDISSPFNIPRTSSNAKSKRPSVSFAEGTRFSPKERRGSAQELAGLTRGKAKSPWGVLMLSALQSQAGAIRSGEDDKAKEEETEEEAVVQVTENSESVCEGVEQKADGRRVQAAGPSGRRRTMSNTAGQKGAQQTSCDAEAGVSHKVTTVYVTLGKTGRPTTKTEPSSEGPVQAMLRRIGSLQRQREQESNRSKSKAEGITKPPRRKLGARATVWEQAGPPEGETAKCKPIRKKHNSQNPSDSSGPGDTQPSEGGNTPKRPLSSILKSVPEAASADSGTDVKGKIDSMSVCSNAGQTESGYLTVGPAGGITELTANEGAMEDKREEPCYENVVIKLS